MAPKKLGYARTNHGKPILEQITALTEAGCHKVFADENSSAREMDRPGLLEVLDALQSGDTLMVDDMTRLVRSNTDYAAFMRLLGEKGVALTLLDHAAASDIASERSV